MKESIQNKPKFEHLVFLGETKFPYGLASIQRMILMSKALIKEELKLTVICRKGSLNPKHHPNHPHKGDYENIAYIYTTGSPFKPPGFISRNLDKLVGIWREYWLLKRLSKKNELDLAILSNRKIFHAIRYLLLARVFNFPLILNLVERASAMNDRGGLGRKINAWIFDHWVIPYFDAALPISNELSQFYQDKAPGKPYLKLPILCDFAAFELPKTPTEDYFLYCGSLSYREVIDFIIRAYGLIEKEKLPKLYMIVSGESKSALNNFRKKLEELYEPTHIRVFSNIPYSELVTLYINAKALLIPLRPTLQDTSRFPHKIGEYLASGNPVITTAIGEINSYFTDHKTALIASEYDEQEFAKKLVYTIENEEDAKSIGIAGKNLGLREFDYRVHGKRLRSFLIDLQSNRKK